MGAVVLDGEAGKIEALIVTPCGKRAMPWRG